LIGSIANAAAEEKATLKGLTNVISTTKAQKGDGVGDDTAILMAIPLRLPTGDKVDSAAP
jgi:hypothetical protein